MNTSSPSILVIRSQIFTMANPAAFIVLLTYTCSAFLFLPRGHLGDHMRSPQFRNANFCYIVNCPLSILDAGIFEINQTPQQSADIFQKNT